MLLRAFAETPLADRCEGALACDRCGNAENSAVEEDLSEAEVDPVPHEEPFERAKGGDEGDDARGEQMRDLGPDVTQL